MPERRRITLHLEAKSDVIEPLTQRVSSYSRLLRIMAMIMMCLTKRSFKGNGITFTTDTLHQAETRLIKLCQKGLNIQDFKNLDPFKDDDGIIRVGGRVDKANITFDERHPILLSGSKKISSATALQYHNRCHSGISTTMAKIRRRFWITTLGKIVKSIKNRCVTCKKYAQRLERQIMAELPESRVNPSPPFYDTACDLFGPFTYKVSRNKTTKVFGVLFTCMS